MIHGSYYTILLKITIKKRIDFFFYIIKHIFINNGMFEFFPPLERKIIFPRKH